MQCIKKKIIKYRSPLAPSSEKPPRHMRAKWRKKRTRRLKRKRRKMRQWSKQTWTPREYPGAETRKPWGQGRWYKLLDASLPSRAYPSRSRTFYAVLITSAIPRPTLLISKWSLLVLCPGPVTLWMSSVLRCAECDACTINYLLS